MSREDLQQTIDDSIAEASEFTRSLFETHRWDAKEVQDYSNEDGGMTIATVGRDGKPHAAIVVAGCADGIFYFSASPKSALLGNLHRDPTIALTISGKIMGRGEAVLAGQAKDLSHLAPQISKTLRRLIEAEWDGYVYSVRLSRLFANSA